MGYLMPKSSLSKNSSGTIKVVGGDSCVLIQYGYGTNYIVVT